MRIRTWRLRRDRQRLYNTILSGCQEYNEILEKVKCCVAQEELESFQKFLLTQGRQLQISELLAESKKEFRLNEIQSKTL
jgi:hypothetical protein